ncbi:interleukin-12 subunit alpha [Meriones unguiculatus]|uniref:Interleukin-12 subunit alpha n=1 Tax=Meriones unguiculatus TaxID=10047 RepID=Q924K6_MERUN|nr:interleukin-12 subunit alpha [Meriones unguiculatus]AAK83072.1 interleukin-12 p35 subunit [Meriones unguiculatus]
MRQSRRLFFLVTLVLIHLSLARAKPVSGPARCLNSSQTLLRTTDNALKTARQKLTNYCGAEDFDREDITKDKTSTLKACLPLELVKNESCLAGETSSMIRGSCLLPQKTSSMMTLCLSSIYEDLKIYQTEFQAIDAELRRQNQITLDKDMLAAIDELMQALNHNGQTVPRKPYLAERDPIKLEMHLCIQLHAFSIRVTTINKVMSYLNSS